MNDNVTLWGVHAGSTGDAESLFLEKNVIALGWRAIGDLSRVAANREAFKARYSVIYPDAKPGNVSASAGQLFRFVHEMKIGDLVAFPSKRSRMIHLGRVTGGYKHNPVPEPGYPQQRTVEWLRKLPRTHFSQGALYEIGSALSLFTIKTYTDEFLMALESPDDSVPVPANEDQTVAEVKHDIEESTSDFILKVLAQQTKGHPFSEFVANLLQTMGYRTRISAPGPDGGVDIVAHKDVLGLEPPIIKVQVKSSDGSVSDPVLSSLYGKVGPSEFGLFVTMGTFTKAAIQFASGKSNLRLIDGVELVSLILEHYELLDSRYKAIMPLRRVYIPEVAGTSGE